MACFRAKRSESLPPPPRSISTIFAIAALPPNHPHALNISRPPSPDHHLIRSPSIVSKLKAQFGRKTTLKSLRSQLFDEDLRCLESRDILFEDSLPSSRIHNSASLGDLKRLPNQKTLFRSRSLPLRADVDIRHNSGHPEHTWPKLNARTDLQTNNMNQHRYLAPSFLRIFNPAPLRSRRRPEDIAQTDQEGVPFRPHFELQNAVQTEQEGTMPHSHHGLQDNAQTESEGIGKYMAEVCIAEKEQVHTTEDREPTGVMESVNDRSTDATTGCSHTAEDCHQTEEMYKRKDSGNADGSSISKVQDLDFIARAKTANGQSECCLSEWHAAYYRHCVDSQAISNTFRETSNHLSDNVVAVPDQRRHLCEDLHLWSSITSPTQARSPSSIYSRDIDSLPRSLAHRSSKSPFNDSGNQATEVTALTAKPSLPHHTSEEPAPRIHRAVYSSTTSNLSLFTDLQAIDLDSLPHDCHSKAHASEEISTLSQRLLSWMRKSRKVQKMGEYRHDISPQKADIQPDCDLHNAQLQLPEQPNHSSCLLCDSDSTADSTSAQAHIENKDLDHVVSQDQSASIQELPTMPEPFNDSIFGPALEILHSSAQLSLPPSIPPKSRPVASRALRGLNHSLSKVNNACHNAVAKISTFDGTAEEVRRSLAQYEHKLTSCGDDRQGSACQLTKIERPRVQKDVLMESALERHLQEKALFHSPSKAGLPKPVGIQAEHLFDADRLASIDNAEAKLRSRPSSITSDVGNAVRSMFDAIRPLRTSTPARRDSQDPPAIVVTDEDSETDRPFANLTELSCPYPMFGTTSWSSSHHTEDESVDPLVRTQPESWSRWPSHSRASRSSAAGPDDDIIVRDFAFHQQAQSKPPKLSRFRNVKRYYTDLLSTTGFHGKGHRTSIWRSGKLKEPDLEMLPPVVSG